MLRAKWQVPEIDDEGRERIAGSHLVSLTFDAFSRLLILRLTRVGTCAL